MEGPNARRTAHLFKVAMLVKGIDGAAELIVATVLLLVSAATVHRLVADVLARDLLGSADGPLAQHVVTVHRSSPSVTRPSGPVPLMLERSTPCSAASLLASGEAFTLVSALLFGCGSAFG